VVRGYFQYQRGAGELGDNCERFAAEVLHYWCRSLRRRSQRSRESWIEMRDRLSALLPPVQILQPYPNLRFDAKYHSIRGKNRVR